MRARPCLPDVAVILMIAALGGATMNSSSVTAATSGPEILLSMNQSDQGAIKVGADARGIPLEVDALGQVADRAGGRRVYLVLDDVQAKQPPGILYDVFLDTKVIGLADANRPQPVGHLNFYELKKRLLSFDVTDRLERLAAQGPSGRTLVVTIAPALGERTTLNAKQQRELNEAGVTLSRVRLVGQ
jgi:hypothetical protein